MTTLFGKSQRLAARASGRDNNFNLIRMIAASAVLVSHAWPLTLGPEAIQPLEVILDGRTLGTVAVLVFFAISGFFITRSFETRNEVKGFLRARVLRIFPGLAVVLLLTILVAGLFLTKAAPSDYWSATPEYFMRNVTLVSLLYPLPGVFEQAPYGSAINGSLWTLFYEVVCYIGVLMAGLLGLLRRPRLFGVGLAAILGLSLASQFFVLPGRLEIFAHLSLPFSVGAAFWVWRDHVPLSLPFALCLAALATVTSGTPVFPYSFVFALSYGVFVLGYANLGLTAYNKLGDYSYGMYIYAFPIQQLVVHWGVSGPLSNIAVTVPLTLICAVCSWHFVEHPALGLRRFPFPRRVAVSAVRKE